MAIDFPNSPTTNQIFTVGSRSWKWDGTIWAIYSNNPVLYRQDSPPSSPQEGDQWFETDTGRMFVYYGTAWVELGNATDVAGALQPGQVTALCAVTSLTSDDVFPVVDNPASATASNKITYGNLVTNMSSSLAPGLVLVKTQTVGTGVSSVTVTGAFSGDYDNYKIVMHGGVASAAVTALTLQLGATTTGYYAGYSRVNYTGTANLTGDNNASRFSRVGLGTTGEATATFELLQPFLAKNTFYTGFFAGQQTTSNGGAAAGFLNDSTSYTAFTIAPASGTLTGGTIRVYGYRNSL
jgi:hypothetical protein